MIRRPFERTYWVEAGKLLAGCYPGMKDAELARERIASVIDCGVTNFVNLMEEDEVDNSSQLFRPYKPLVEEIARSRGIQVSFVRFPIPDMGVVGVPEMVEILDSIDGAAEAGRISYLHCWGGRGRTGTVVGCWLVRHGMVPGQPALDRIQELRQVVPEAYRGASPEAGEQRAMVLAWRTGQ